MCVACVSERTKERIRLVADSIARQSLFNLILSLSFYMHTERAMHTDNQTLLSEHHTNKQQCVRCYYFVVNVIRYRLAVRLMRVCEMSFQSKRHLTYGTAQPTERNICTLKRRQHDAHIPCE